MSRTLAYISIVVLILLFPIYMAAVFLRWVCNYVIRAIDAITVAMEKRVNPKQNGEFPFNYR